MSLFLPVFMRIRFKNDCQNQLFATISNNLSCKIILPYKILFYCYKKYQSYSLPPLKSFRRTLLYPLRIITHSVVDRYTVQIISLVMAWNTNILTERLILQKLFRIKFWTFFHILPVEILFVSRLLCCGWILKKQNSNKQYSLSVYCGYS